MAEAQVLDVKGAKAGKAKLDDSIFGIEPNLAVMHQVVTAQLAAKRSGTHSTKTRSTARGGGAKPWRQKGTGRARQGSIRNPHWRGGGVAHGPQPRSYAQRLPKKMRSLALRSALSDRTQDSKTLVVKDWEFGDEPSTKLAVEKLDALGVEGKVLIILPRDATIEAKSFRNLVDVHLLTPDQLNTYDVLVSDFLIFTEPCLESVEKLAILPKTDADTEPNAEADESEDKVEDETTDKVEDKAKTKSKNKSEDKSKNKAEDKSESKAEKKVEEKAEEKTEKPAKSSSSTPKEKAKAETKTETKATKTTKKEVKKEVKDD